MKKLFLYCSYMLLAAITFTSCEVFGLKLQEPYDYDSEAGKCDNNVYMSTWDFMKSRPDIFSEMLNAVRYSGVDSNLYLKPNYTFLLLTNQALTSETATNRSFFYEHPYQFIDPLTNDTTMITPTSWEEIHPDTVKNMLMYHMIKYPLSYNELTVMTKGVNYFFPTEHPEGIPMAFEMQKEGALSLYINNFPSHYKLKMKPRTANLYSKDKSYIHVMDSYSQYPSEYELKNFPHYEK